VLKEAVIAAAGRAEVCDAVARIYADLLQEIDARRPKCSTSGRCCRFDEFGHRLYVTTMELAAFVSSPGITARRAVAGGCPFQVEGLCSVHSARPFGCRVFFCDASSEQWQYKQYERFHARLRALHDAMGVPYLYVEWRHALKELDLALPNDEQSGKISLSLPQVRL